MVVQHNPSDRATDLDDVEALVTRWRGHWERFGFGNCSVFEEKTGRLVGNCGLRWMTIRGDRVLNLMYRFHPSTWGQGYATEAAAAQLQWALEQLPSELVVARVGPMIWPVSASPRRSACDGIPTSTARARTAWIGGSPTGRERGG